MPDVTVVIPTHNRASLVLEAVDSCLVQESDGLSIEVIVVDDASTDDTLRRLQSYGDRIVVIPLCKNVRVCEARNTALPRARGRYTKFLDSDDVLLPDVLSAEISLANLTESDMVLTGWMEHDGGVESSPRVYAAPAMVPVIDAVLAGRAVPTTAALYRTEWLNASGLRWDSSLGGSLDDWDFFCQAALRARRIEAMAHAGYVMRGHSGPRITTGVSMLENARAHHRILRKIEALLAANGELTESRRARLAQYYYKELRVLSLYDRGTFDESLRHMYTLDPDFSPRDEEPQTWIRLLVDCFGVRPVLTAHSALKRFVGRADLSRARG